MKIKSLFRLVLAAGLFTAMPVVMAKPHKDKADKAELKEAKKDKKGKKEKANKNAVQEALKDITFVTDKRPDPKAKFFIYLQSSRHCGPCNQEMPNVVKAYKDMPKGKTELIFICRDASEEDAKEFMKKYGADFPCIMIGSPDIQKLPGFSKSDSYPMASIVDGSGAELQSTTYAQMVMRKWKQITSAAGK